MQCSTKILITIRLDCGPCKKFERQKSASVFCDKRKVEWTVDGFESIFPKISFIPYKDSCLIKCKTNSPAKIAALLLISFPLNFPCRRSNKFSRKNLILEEDN